MKRWSGVISTPHFHAYPIGIIFRRSEEACSGFEEQVQDLLGFGVIRLTEMNVTREKSSVGRWR